MEQAASWQHAALEQLWRPALCLTALLPACPPLPQPFSRFILQFGIQSKFGGSSRRPPLSPAKPVSQGLPLAPPLSPCAPVPPPQLPAAPALDAAGSL